MRGVRATLLLVFAQNVWCAGLRKRDYIVPTAGAWAPDVGAALVGELRPLSAPWAPRQLAAPPCAQAELPGSVLRLSSLPGSSFTDAAGSAFTCCCSIVRSLAWAASTPPSATSASAWASASVLTSTGLPAAGARAAAAASAAGVHAAAASASAPRAPLPPPWPLAQHGCALLGWVLVQRRRPSGVVALRQASAQTRRAAALQLPCAAPLPPGTPPAWLDTHQ